ncbi:MAG: nucleotidyltransferase domain-containing protein [Alphaproteobacteria bacterium]|jgi:predicted nucleotidyltransferase|nr:nucleotidyltransferase domain-containing protein [Alphaproteobacteria bacterium]
MDVRGSERWVVGELSRFPDVERVILYGSRARGDAAPRSDIDLAVDCPLASRSMWLRMIDAFEEADALLFIDPVRLHEASAELRDRIRTEGQVLYDRQAEPIGRQSRPRP